ncbi:MAG: hypothetical protein AVDCRST_MAG08-1025, partial [uncultured Acetobacteraceae bacterium]
GEDEEHHQRGRHRAAQHNDRRRVGAVVQGHTGRGRADREGHRGGEHQQDADGLSVDPGPRDTAHPASLLLGQAHADDPRRQRAGL